MTARATIKCVTCGRPIEGAAVTRHDGGWVHVVTRSEKCAPPHRSLASPVTLEDLNRKTLADAARSRRRAGIKPR